MLYALTTAGKAKLAAAANANTQVNIGKIDVGAAFGFTPDKLGTGVIPSVSYSLPKTILYKTAISKEEVVITIKLDHMIAGPVGNLMVYFDDNTPFFWLALPRKYTKTATVQSSAGDKYFLHYKLYYPKLAQILANVQDFYASQDYYEDFNDLLDSQVQPYFQYMVNNNNDRMVHTAKLNNVWFGVPWMMRTDDPKFWRFDGGRAGDGYKYVFNTD